MSAALRAGVAYGAALFAAGFVLGVARVLLVAPALGPVAAVVLELPVMLALAWGLAGVLARRFAVPGQGADRLAMGLVGFAVLMVCEVGLGLWGFGRSWAEVRAGFGSPEGALGLAGQALVAAMPLMRRKEI